MKFKDIKESVVRKRAVRAGKMKILFTSSNPGFKIVGGKEKIMSSAEKLKRKMSQKKASKKRKSKQSLMNLKRQRSLSRRTWK